MIMQIYYLNDRKIPITVQTNGQLKPSAGNPYGMPQIDYYRLQPQEGRLFDVDVPEGSIPWVKVWETGTVLLSYILPGELPSATQTESGKLKDGEPSET